ncbi:hypothetical protein, partial [Pseudomonas viridiflava]|uniref:hypothetical protein n=1 Tax=Pseudomonas viridiflava TaxID=33069 RepID=UPI0019809044
SSQRVGTGIHETGSGNRRQKRGCNLPKDQQAMPAERNWTAFRHDVNVSGNLHSQSSHLNNKKIEDATC